VASALALVGAGGLISAGGLVGVSVGTSALDGALVVEDMGTPGGGGASYAPGGGASYAPGGGASYAPGGGAG